MDNYKTRFFTNALLFILVLCGLLYPQQIFKPIADPCGYDEQAAMALLQELGPGWGYNYDSLMTDLEKWRTNPSVTIDSIGASVEGRALWRLTVTDRSIPDSGKIRISIHARTHPSEVQSSWVTNEMISILLEGSRFSEILLSRCIFNILPMYNPDGVELGYGRQNANGVDLESNWNAAVLEPETAALKRSFEDYMASANPVRVALNMHSSSRGSRFFVCHHEGGTSPAYFEDEKYFIGSVRYYWPEGIEPWDFFVTWVNSTPNHYPESWYWLNYGEAVMALTYEDIWQNNKQNGQYNRTAGALLNGVADYLNIGKNTAIENQTSPAFTATDFEAVPYPNPLPAQNTLKIQLAVSGQKDITVAFYDILGRCVIKAKTVHLNSGSHRLQLELPALSAGVYFLQIHSQSSGKTIPVTIIR